jgi:16S rRNA (cytidine1402-2'-O)-methyltransferase
MSGTLYVVATPIGNLEDITLRALRTLREVTVIAAEDTRRTAKLLHHHAIETPTVSFHEHNARARTPQLVKRLQTGESVALVTDAGTPAISDPGLELVRACADAGIPIDPVPGPSAVLTALVASGFPAEPVTFLGFAPNRGKARTNWLHHLSTVDHTVVFFEAPHRIRQLLEDGSSILGERPLVVARELTKVHQEFLRGTAGELAVRLNNPRGEFTVVVGQKPQAVAKVVVVPDDAFMLAEFRQMTDSGGFSRREAITQLARKYDRPARDIYARLEAAKTSVP